MIKPAKSLIIQLNNWKYSVILGYKVNLKNNTLCMFQLTKETMLNLVRHNKFKWKNFITISKIAKPLSVEGNNA